MGNFPHSFQAVQELDCSLNVSVSLLFNPNQIFLPESVKKIDCIVTELKKNVVSYWLVVQKQSVSPEMALK